MQALLASDGDYAVENGVLQNGHVSIRIEAAHPAVMLPETLVALATTMLGLLKLPKPKSRKVLPLCGWTELNLTVPGMAEQVCRSFLCRDEFSSDHWVTTRMGIVRSRYIVSIGQ